MANSRPKVAIIGAGFAGMSAIRALRNAPVDITVIDRNNYYTFQPLLYQVATALLEPNEVARSVRASLRRQRNVEFVLAGVTGVSWEHRAVLLDDGSSVSFDYLIQAAGSAYNHFGIPGVAENAFFLKTLTEANNLRSHILTQFERASREPELIDDGLLEFVIIGGGPTGVEMAGALVELFDRVLPRDFPGLDVSRARVHLVEALPRLLSTYHESLSRHAEQVLSRRGVQLHLGTALEELSGDTALFRGGLALRSKTVIWAAGVRASQLAGKIDSPAGRANRLTVNDDLSLPGRRFAFAAGDIVGAIGPEERVYPQVGQVAIQQGRFAARQILQLLRGAETDRFEYRDRGNMAIVGRNSGVAELSPRLGGLRFSGFLGFLAWLFIHLVYLPGHRNRFGALLSWAIHYVTFDRHARLITRMEPSKGDWENRQ